VSCGREDQRPRLRDEPAPDDDAVVIRGGTDSLAKLRAHGLRTQRAWCLDGVPIFGISVFAVMDDIGPGSARAILGRRLVTYRSIHVTTAGQLRQDGRALLSTGRRPHLTVVLPAEDDTALAQLLAPLGPVQDNREYLAAHWGPGSDR